MKILAALVLSAACAFAQSAKPDIGNAAVETVAYSGDLQKQIHAPAPTWFGYAIDSVQKDNDNCCWNGQRGCWLEAEDKQHGSVKQSAGRVPLEGSGRMLMLFRVQNDSVQKIRSFSFECPLDAGGLRFVWITNVPAAASVSYLRRFATAPEDHLADAAVFAIAQDTAPEADTVLEELSRPANPERTREKVSFWLGAARGARGADLLKKMLATDPSENVRTKVTFALSVSKQSEALETLIAAAHNDPSAHVREQALFWLAQKAGKRAAETIQNAIENDPDTGVKRKAVFALSQLPKDEGIPKLISIAQTQRNPEVRKQAFFWLGQSNDPRALAFIQQVLTK
ncbi:MAG TPA: HEAT repeat domain-containing protein [Bryobacteraceae bacterium]|jgi:hypothetical protein|nr:HEAT repeat domain-containing protein [Bryobacteraceae bacterium]